MLLLPIIILIPFLAATLLNFLDVRRAHSVSLIASAAVLALTLAAVALAYINGTQSLGFSYSYIPALSVQFDVQFTSLTLMLTLMTAIVFFSASLVGEYFIEKSRLYNMLFLLAEGASIGVFLAGNLLLLYLFWEISEVMMFFIIFVFGGYDRRYAAIKFIVYSLASSLLLLIAVLLLYSSTSSFSIATIAKASTTIPHAVQLLVLVLFALSFMIKAPVFPFHSWLPDAHTEAPTMGSMILAGVLLKFGGYGFLLMFLLLPVAHSYALYFAVLFGFSSIYSAFAALRQRNLKRMIAYTSILDMGIVALGAAASGVIGDSGSIYAMLSHGIAISILFLVAGTVDELYGTLDITKISGVMSRFPTISYLFVAGVFAIIGLPLTAGFVGDILVFIGAFASFGMIGLAPLVGIIVIGAALFWTFERVFLRTSRITVPYRIPDNTIMYSLAFLMVSTILAGMLPFLLISASGL